ncbi:hypothetical protein HYC85_005957 [Camellia sinensis]|uniref:ENTH domain-containing protein n=1 Tax=Camellia sinensis TaxID=4442 RepID=A0A7J7I0Y9_CAMSI|nr:hypothetical protein HYC85_005957 [Camellia sinensis]
MDFMKVIDQTVREIKREVNLKVLKIPEIEQKVLDATDDEPWGPHGTALAEIAQATKKFSECQMVMNVLWTRLSETGKNWRYVYKALTVVEYLVANGSERAVDEIIEHTYQISSLASFEYLEPSRKDMGINVRKKAEKIVSLLNDKDKIQEVRNKAAANRDKFFGLSSSGITYKSGSSSFSGSDFQSSDRYGGFSSKRESDEYKGNYKDKDRFGEKKFDQSTSTKPNRGVTNENQGSTPKKGSTRHGSKRQDTSASGGSRSATVINDSDKHSSVPTQSSSAPSNNYDDDFDDFDPRGISSAKSAAGDSNQVDLFGQSLAGDLINAPASVPKEMCTVNGNSSEVDLFADAAFVSAPPHVEAGATSETQPDKLLFGAEQAGKAERGPRLICLPLNLPHLLQFLHQLTFFAAPDPIALPEKNSSKSDTMNTNAADPFAIVSLNNFDGSDIFGTFTSKTDSVSAEAKEKPNGSHNNLNEKSSAESEPPPKKDPFQVKSGIWADSLSRGLIDLNIAAPNKVSLADVGIVGLSDGSDERAMGTGSGLGASGFTSSSGNVGDDMFSTIGSQQYQFDSFKK